MIEWKPLDSTTPKYVTLLGWNWKTKSCVEISLADTYLREGTFRWFDELHSFSHYAIINQPEPERQEV